MTSPALAGAIAVARVRRMWCGKRIGLVWVVVYSALGLSGCKTGCDADAIQRATAFLDAHQACESDDDCVNVGDYCGELPGGFCGQVPMNREGASSAEWARIDAELRDCAPDACSVCDALRVPKCTAGSCRGTE